MMDVVEGDKIFMAADEPSAVPANDVFTVQGIISAGGNRRQTFLCTYTA